jgi:hypothetical protein
MPPTRWTRCERSGFVIGEGKVLVFVSDEEVMAMHRVIR